MSTDLLQSIGLTMLTVAAVLQGVALALHLRSHRPAEQPTPMNPRRTA